MFAVLNDNPIIYRDWIVTLHQKYCVPDSLKVYYLYLFTLSISSFYYDTYSYLSKVQGFGGENWAFYITTCCHGYKGWSETLGPANHISEKWKIGNAEEIPSAARMKAEEEKAAEVKARPLSRGAELLWKHKGG